MGQRTERGLLMEKQSILVRPSYTYRILSACVRLLNMGKLKLVKRIMYQGFAHPRNRETLLRWMHRQFSVEVSEFQGYPVYMLTAEHSRPDKMLLFLHGGGGRMRPTILHYHTVAWLLRHTDHSVVLPFYPLAPKANAAQAREWSEALYGFLNRASGFRRWIFMGDSAGANLSARIIERHPEWAKGVILLSPAAGVAEMHGTMCGQEKEDILLDTKMLAMIAESWCGGIPLTHPDVDAEAVDYRQFPPVLLCYGGKELFAPYVRKIGSTLLAHVCGAQVYEGQSHCHDWMLAGFLPEAWSMRGRILDFIRGERRC
jgi:acetyl esterase/lipase